MNLRSMARRRAVTACVTALALEAPLPAAHADEYEATKAQPSYLFTVEAPSGTTTILKPRGRVERMRLTLNGVEPVTMFTDRPLRNARLISPTALSTHWSTWFADSPPNAVMTWSSGVDKAPSSFVVTLTDIDYDADRRQLTFTAERDPRQHDPAEKGPNWQRKTTPSTFTQASLFIDNAGATIVNGCLLESNSSCPGADLSGANLSSGTAPETDFTNANLAGVDFSWKDLSRADFSGANPVGANFTGARIDGTKFYGSDLTAATITGLTFQMTAANTICPDGTKGYCAPWTPGPDDLPVDRPSGKGDWECKTTSEFDPWKLKKVPVTSCGPVS